MKRESERDSLCKDHRSGYRNQNKHRVTKPKAREDEVSVIAQLQDRTASAIKDEDD